jgi:hypothetical protein
MNVSVSIAPTAVSLGQPVTITYSSTGFADTILTIDNIPAPIDLGGGDVSGSLRILPVIAGGFIVEIKGSGVEDRANDYVPELTKTASCTVN